MKHGIKMAEKKKLTKKVEPKPKAKIGRPTKYTLDMATRICEAIAVSTDSYLKICADNPDFPDRTNMRLWRYRHEEFRHMYDQAKRDQAELLAEEIQEIADFSGYDTIVNPKTGQEMMNAEWVARSRLKVDTRKWIACKLLPKVYGDKQQHEQTVTIKHEDRLKELK